MEVVEDVEVVIKEELWEKDILLDFLYQNNIDALNMEQQAGSETEL